MQITSTDSGDRDPEDTMSTSNNDADTSLSRDGKAGSLDLAWNPDDQNALHPSHLSLSKVQRAWDRKPKSPFSRARFKVGKVWKRANHSGPTFTKPTPSHPSPVKIVKKMCLESGFGIGAQVRNWEPRGSPVARRIVTRSIVAERDADHLVALPEEDGDADSTHDDATVEVVHEDGTVEPLGLDDTVNEWSDVGEDEDGSAFDHTLMHLNEAVDHETGGPISQPMSGASVDQEDTNAEASLDSDVTPASDDQDLKDELHDLPSTRRASPIKDIALPEGFVSPAIPRTRRTIKGSRLSSVSRRRTLPTNFTPTTLLHDDLPAAIDPVDNTMSPKDTSNVDQNVEHAARASELLQHQDGEPDLDRTMVDLEDDDQWEDVEPHVSNKETTTTVYEDAPTRGTSPRTTPEPLNRSVRHPPWPRTSSPMKDSKVWSDSERSHLIAFTPMKMPQFPPPAVSCSPVTGTPLQVSSLLPGPQWARSSSAPPEEHHVSPPKPKQPRISDDTALLQAFLNRAAEGRSSRRLSETARRESLENRRDSDSVRRALADNDITQSTVPPTVLADLDPNSPSPRKVPFTEIVTDTKPEEQNADDDSGSPARDSNSRRSRRVKKKPEVLSATTYSAPSRISIRACTEPIFLKRSEAQEMALLTRNNTRKNKGGSVLPPQRLTRLVRETSPNKSFEISQGSTTPPKTSGRSVRWAETLVALHHFIPEYDESSVDESSEDGPVQSTGDGDVDLTGAAAVRIADKPRARRPKQPRTESSAPQEETTQVSTVAFEEPVPASADVETTKPKATKRRSRIATPAKVKGKSLLSITDEADEVLRAPALPPTARKAASKLPAPTTLSLASGSASGKESPLISSPPKKRMRPMAGILPSKPAGKASSMSKFDLTTPSISFEPERRRGDLASPAKKPLMTFVSGTEGASSSAESRDLDDINPPGLSSPAKKRSRRNVR